MSEISGSVNEASPTTKPPEVHLMAVLRATAVLRCTGEKQKEKRNHCNCECIETLIEAARHHASRFPPWLRRHAKFEVAKPIHCRIIAFLLLIHYSTLWPWPLTYDLEHLECFACDVTKLCTKCERNWAIRGGVIAISIFALMTLNAV